MSSQCCYGDDMRVNLIQSLKCRNIISYYLTYILSSKIQLFGLGNCSLAPPVVVWTLSSLFLTLNLSSINHGSFSIWNTTSYRACNISAATGSLPKWFDEKKFFLCENYRYNYKKPVSWNSEEDLTLPSFLQHQYYQLWYEHQQLMWWSHLLHSHLWRNNT